MLLAKLAINIFNLFFFVYLEKNSIQKKSYLAHIQYTINSEYHFDNSKRLSLLVFTYSVFTHTTTQIIISNLNLRDKKKQIEKISI